MARVKYDSLTRDSESEYYCTVCGAGKREYMGCELSVCTLARRKKRNVIKKDKAKG